MGVFRQFSTQVVRIPNKAVQSKVFTLLQYSGRALTNRVPELGLAKGNRLMPCPDMQDVANFEYKSAPFEAVFWVGGIHDRLLHDNPLLLVEGLGLGTFSVDLMHTWHLGPMQQLVSLSLHCCLGAEILNPYTLSLSAEDRKKVGLMAIKADLFQWYKEQHKDPEWVAKGTEDPQSKHVHMSQLECKPSWFLCNRSLKFD